MAAPWRTHRGEAVVLLVTDTAIVVTHLFEGVWTGLTLATAKATSETSHVHIEQVREDDALYVRVVGDASFLWLPKLFDAVTPCRGESVHGSIRAGCGISTTPARARSRNGGARWGRRPAGRASARPGSLRAWTTS